MTTPTPDKITRLVKRREKLTNRRDERINRPAVDEIDAQLAQLPAGERNDVDLLLGRRSAVLPDRAYAIAAALEREGDRNAARPATDTEAATQTVAELAGQMRSAFDTEMRRLCADYDIEAPDYPGMWK